jgi:hypothetical protein
MYLQSARNGELTNHIVVLCKILLTAHGHAFSLM